jgi:hypothetical protein
MTNWERAAVGGLMILRALQILGNLHCTSRPHRACSVERMILHYSRRLPPTFRPHRACSVGAAVACGIMSFTE